jgi:hypothetical protein
MQCAMLPSSVSLTPPSSPSDPINTDVSKASASAQLPSSVITSSPCVSSQSFLPKSLPNHVDKKKLTQALVQEVWKDITAPKPPPRYNQMITSFSDGYYKFFRDVLS